MGEFDLIRRCFSFHAGAAPGVLRSVGDDCAVLEAGPLAVSTDTLVAGVHFPPEAPAEWIAERAVRVCTSDLAAMAAEPLAATLALSLTPEAFEQGWAERFAGGLRPALERAGLRLVGGDTTRGSVSITLTVMGRCEKPVSRDGARPGHRIGVTGALGGARAALVRPDLSRSREHPFNRRYWQPPFRLEFARRLAGRVSAMLDISDGLLADLGHILAASRVGATLDGSKIPMQDNLPASQALEWALTGGDDYELCFTCPPAQMADIEALACELDVPVTWIGDIVAGQGLHVTGFDLASMDIKGFEHFG
ncbi:MAG: thiamine-phosphate kinase [Gammaproteobacteria bacterium]|nr:MAG: thiamine-phosphate kinase [Gammaproteobacteria bacterium]